MVKNSLKDLAAKKPPILKDEATQKPERADTSPPAQAKIQQPAGTTTPEEKPVERKPPSEKTSERVQTMLTPAEAKKLLKKAGNVPMSKFLRIELQKAGLI